jgi:hypothetical protein
MVYSPACLVVALKGVTVDESCLLVYIHSTGPFSRHSIFFVFDTHHSFIETTFYVVKVETVHGNELREQLSLYLLGY